MSQNSLSSVSTSCQNVHGDLSSKIILMIYQLTTRLDFPSVLLKNRKPPALKKKDGGDLITQRIHVITKLKSKEPKGTFIPVFILERTFSYLLHSYKCKMMSAANRRSTVICKYK